MKALLVDGYNIIYAHPELAATVEKDQDAAREGLLKELSPLATPDHYEVVVVVFDAAGSSQPQPVVQERGSMTVVFTRRQQSADAFIERIVRRLVPNNEVVVATSDRLLTGLVSGFGARTIDAQSLLGMTADALHETREEIKRMAAGSRSHLEDRVSEEVRRLLDEMRYR
ncbi:MAG: NYN domain-containing protein [Actinobacteria bacterium]|nr:NYN domain-containing protein [Actinomycetota bacterium]